MEKGGTMKIVTLMENDTIDKRLKNAHGLSFYVEHKDHKILFDLGPNNNFFMNAEVLGIDLTEVDTVVISHGHFDHGKGLKLFLEINDKAKIYLSKNAFNKQYKKVWFMYIPIGLKKPKELDRFVFIDKNYDISEDIKIELATRYMRSYKKITGLDFKAEVEDVNQRILKNLKDTNYL